MYGEPAQQPVHEDDKLKQRIILKSTKKVDLVPGDFHGYDLVEIMQGEQDL